MYELIILARLMRHSAHGYLIAKIINDMIGPFAKISNGRFYPLLTKLEQDGLIEAHLEPLENQHGDRQARHYSITEKGRQRYHQLMMDTTSNPGEYAKFFLYKTSTLDLLQPSERSYLIDHYINYCQAHVLHLKAEEDDLRQRPEYGLKPVELKAILSALQHLKHQWQVELNWAKELRQEEETVAQVTALPEFSKN